MTKPLFLARLDRHAGGDGRTARAAHRGRCRAAASASTRRCPSACSPATSARPASSRSAPSRPPGRRASRASRPPELAARTRAFIDAVAETQPGQDRRAARLTFATMDSMQNCVSLVARAKIGPFSQGAARARHGRRRARVLDGDRVGQGDRGRRAAVRAQLRLPRRRPVGRRARVRGVRPRSAASATASSRPAAPTRPSSPSSTRPASCSHRTRGSTRTSPGAAR